MTKQTETIGDRIRAVREANDRTPADLAAACGWTGKYATRRVTRYEKGEREPSYEDLQTLARTLDVSIGWLLTGEEDAAAAGGGIEILPIAKVFPDPDQPRKAFDEEAIDELAESIRVHGILQPPVVRRRQDLVEGEMYIIVSGERRWRAAHRAELDTIPAIVRDDIQDDDVAALQIVENLQRVDLSLPEIVKGVSALCQDRSAADVARMLGRSRSWVSRRAHIMNLRTEVQDLVFDGHLRDVDMAHDLNAFADVEEHSPWRFDDVIKACKGEHQWMQPPSRERLREWVNHGKDRAKQIEEFLKQGRDEHGRLLGEDGKPAPMVPPQPPELTEAEKKAAEEREREGQRRQKAREQIASIAEQAAHNLKQRFPDTEVGKDEPFFEDEHCRADVTPICFFGGEPQDGWTVHLRVDTQEELDDLVKLLLEHWRPAGTVTEDDAKAAAETASADA